MRRTIWLTILVSACVVAAAVVGAATVHHEKEPGKGEPSAKTNPPVKKVAVGKNVSVEIEERKVVRVVVEARVCLRSGCLEHLLCRLRTKEHEAILAADIDARHLHTALLLAGAQPGKPVVFRPKELPPTGSPVRITLAYKDKAGAEVQVPAQKWIRHIKTGKDLQPDWVFVGSGDFVDPIDPSKVFYRANDGDVICVANFEGALLDLPILSSSSGELLDYEAHTERIPPQETPVRVILEPVRPRKK